MTGCVSLDVSTLYRRLAVSSSNFENTFCCQGVCPGDRNPYVTSNIDLSLSRVSQLSSFFFLFRFLGYVSTCLCNSRTFASQTLNKCVSSLQPSLAVWLDVLQTLLEKKETWIKTTKNFVLNFQQQPEKEEDCKMKETGNLPETGQMVEVMVDDFISFCASSFGYLLVYVSRKKRSQSQSPAFISGFDVSSKIAGSIILSHLQRRRGKSNCMQLVLTMDHLQETMKPVVSPSTHNKQVPVDSSSSFSVSKIFVCVCLLSSQKISEKVYLTRSNLYERNWHNKDWLTELNNKLALSLSLHETKKERGYRLKVKKKEKLLSLHLPTHLVSWSLL